MTILGSKMTLFCKNLCKNLCNFLLYTLIKFKNTPNFKNVLWIMCLNLSINYLNITKKIAKKGLFKIFKKTPKITPF